MKLMNVRWLALVALLSLGLVFAGCDSDSSSDDGGNDVAEQPQDDTVGGDEDVTTDPEGVDLQTFLAPVQTYFDSGKPPVIAASQIFDEAVAGGDDSYFLVDIRDSPDHYGAGHVEGALHIPYKSWATAEALDQLPAVEDGKKIVIICHTGHKASQVMLLLYQLGYDAYAMKFGMMGWVSMNQDVIGVPTYCQWDAPNAFPTVTEPTEAETFDMPVIESDLEGAELILARTQAYFDTEGASPVFKPGDIYNNVIVGGDTGYFFVDIRDSADHYAAGHIDGAIHVPFKDWAKVESFQKLPTDKKIVVICHTGHKASQITMLLRQLGYDAAALAYGMMGWTDQPDVIGLPAEKLATCDADYAVVE